MAPSRTLMPEHLPPHISARQEQGPASREPNAGTTLEQAGQELIRQTLAKCGGNRTRAAKLLGISRRTLHYRISNRVS
jgi:DNA-binding NtrC family response regulator